MNRFILVFLGLVATPISSYTQISGTSASKIAAMHAFPVDYKAAEFEPTYNYSRNKNDIRGDSISLMSNISWRITYGLTKDVELGFNTGNNFSASCLSTKAKLYESEKLALGALAGVGLSLGNRVIGDEADLLTGYGVGFISTHTLDAKNSLDLNVQYYKSIDSYGSLIINADFGSYSLMDKWLLVAGLGYQSTIANPIVTLYLGVSIETSTNYGVVFAPSITLSGADVHTNPQTYGFGFSFTTFWN